MKIDTRPFLTLIAPDGKGYQCGKPKGRPLSLAFGSALAGQRVVRDDATHTIMIYDRPPLKDGDNVRVDDLRFRILRGGIDVKRAGIEIHVARLEEGRSA